MINTGYMRRDNDQFYTQECGETEIVKTWNLYAISLGKMNNNNK